MEDDLVVVVLAHEPDKVLDRLGHLVWEEVERDISLGRVNHSVSTQGAS